MSIKWNKINPTNELDKKLYETFINTLRHGFVEIGEDKTVMSMHFLNIAEKCANLEVRNSDIIVASYPKTGTTWTQEMVWMLINNLDFEGGKRHIVDRFPFLEYSGLYTYEDAVKLDPNFELKPFMVDSPKCIDKLEETPRFIKTHLPWCLLPNQIKNNTKTPKIIYITRNSKDTCVSYYHQVLWLSGYKGNFETFSDLFMSGRINYGNYYNHIQGYWNQKHLSNILFIKFEDMKQDLTSVIKKVATFLNKSLSEQEISALVKHLSFDEMKKNSAVDFSIIGNRRFYDNKVDGSKFLRSGTVGSYKTNMTEKIEEKFDKWIAENVERTGIEIEHI